MNNNDAITNILTAILIVMLVILFFMIIAFIVVKISSDKKKKETYPVDNDEAAKAKEKEKLAATAQYTKQSIYKFMEFDKISDNMIIRKNGKMYVMVIECQGINYDLMSGVEKTGVEQGFLQFLNTIRFPIQIYVQTRTVNLSRSIVTYKDRLKEVENRYLKKQLEYNSKSNTGQYSPKEINDMRMEVIRERNLYEYGKDIISNTERMSLNRNILSKHYYIVIEYMPEETEMGDYGKDEFQGMAFSELYTRAQSIISSLAVCGIKGKVLDSNALIELLYMAYNREQADVFGLDKLIASKYEDLYSTAQDVIERRSIALDKKIQEEALRKANDKLYEAQAEREKEIKIKKKEEELDDLINQMAKQIIDENKKVYGSDLAERAKKNIDKEAKEEKSDVKETKQRKRAEKSTTKI